ncbi:MAG: hypothetical protein Q8N54_07150 [Sulfurimicrobium sp.]|jgi:3-hydroxymyristoyl/3-hydroxydecanoyl-(acyl carrier protein) dehydratase|nr:hypothetical protein [Sulfurimicrobium sp.]
MSEWQVIPENHPALPGHFPGKPIVPGVVLLNYICAAMRRDAGEGMHCSGFPSVKFLSPLLPGEAFAITLDFGAGGRVRFVCKTEDRIIAQGSMQIETAAGVEP